MKRLIFVLVTLFFAITIVEDYSHAKKTAKASKSKKKKQEDPNEGWKVDRIEVPTDYKPTEQDLSRTKFWNYVDGPEVKDDVYLKNGQVIKQLGYNLQFVDQLDQGKGNPPIYIFKSTSCRGACGGGSFYALYNPARKEYFEFPLAKEGYVHEEGELERDVSKHLWTKSEGYYGDCGKLKSTLIIYHQERECKKCPLLHELRTGKVKNKAFQIETERDQGVENPKAYKKLIEGFSKDIKKKTCRVLPAL